MTLFKKARIKNTTHMAIYSSCLLLSISYMLKTTYADRQILLSVLIIYGLRIKYSINKYWLWGFFMLVYLPSFRDQNKMYTLFKEIISSLRSQNNYLFRL